jgi:gliding motility-associated-like protein
MYLSDTSGASVIARPITDVRYEVVTTNQFGCRDTAYTSIVVDAGAVLYLGDSSITLYPGQTYQLNPQTNCTSFMWTPAAGLSNSYISNPVASPELSTKYMVVGTTNWGCVATDSINIFVDPQSVLALPNAFTPGNSGPNSQLKIILLGEATLSYFRIFDRWGNQVFETADINQGWDGTYKGTPQPFGVYVYMISAVTSTGQNFEKHGNVTLLR